MNGAAVSHGAPSIVVHATPSYPTWEFLCFTLAMGYTAKLSFLNRLSWYVGDMVSSTVFSSVEAHIVAERAVAIPSSAPGMDVSGRANSAATLFIYSERIVPRPKEWVETNIHITGTVTLESRRVTSIPEPLQEFIRTARKKSGDAKLAYIGLGSMLELYVSREKAPSVMSILATAAQAAGCWTIVSTLGVPDLQVEVPHPERAFFTAESLPHDALFALCDVAAHHGGAGTTHAVARGGASSVVIPCVVDQPFWGGALHHKGYALGFFLFYFFCFMLGSLFSHFPFFFFSPAFPEPQHRTSTSILLRWRRPPRHSSRLCGPSVATRPRSLERR
jgi:hypothetical protein